MASRWVKEGWKAGSDDGGAWICDPASRIRFRLLPEGNYSVGLSDQELHAARQISSDPQWSVKELTPVVTLQIKALWVAELPVSCAVARSADLSVSGGDMEPAMLTFDEVEALRDYFGWRCLSEAEWETCCRGGRASLFAWGDRLPEKEVLGEWLSWDMMEEGLPRNGLGFGSLFFGEWCEDPFRVGRDAGAAVVEGARVIKGGGAQFWPWQTAEEWVWCASAMRMPSTDLFADGRAAFRPGLRLAPGMERESAGVVGASRMSGV